MNSEVYIVAPNCLVIDGASKSILVDLQRQSFRGLTNKQRSMLVKPFREKELTLLNSEDLIFIESLIKEDIIVLLPANQVKFFPKINSQYFNSTIINNSIIEISAINLRYIDKILDSLTQLGCKILELRFPVGYKIAALPALLKKISLTTIQTVDIYISWTFDLNMSYINKLQKEIAELRRIYIYGTPVDIKKELNSKRKKGMLFISGTLEKTDCGYISPFYFSVDIPTYTESVHYNSCLNCKISVDSIGEIRNCPSLKKTFGNIKEDSLEDAVKKRNFKEFGNIKKDEIKVCKDCEFRYICTDCRAYVEDPNDKFSKPLKCGYDPYTGKWEEWSTNPLKQKAIKHYGMEHLVKK